MARFAHLTLVLALFAAACGGGGGDYRPLTSDDPVAELADGLTVSANPAGLPDGFGVQLTAVPAADFAGGAAGEAWAAAQSALPAYLQLLSPVFDIKTQGALPEQLFLSVVVPAGADARRLDLYAWDGAAWSFLPAQARGGQLVAVVTQPPSALALFANVPLPPLALTILEPGQALTPAVTDAVNAVLLGGVLAQADGALGGQLPGVPLDGQYAVYPLVRGDAAGLAALLAAPAATGAFLQNVVGFVVGEGYDGVALDFEGLAPESGPAYAQLASDLGAQLRTQGKGLFVQVPWPAASGDAFQTGAYDWRALGMAADSLLIAAGDDPTAFGNGQVEALLAWAVGEVPRGRLRLLTTALSVESAGGVFSLIDQAAALAPLGAVTLADAEALEPGKPITVKLSGGVQTLAYDPLAFAASYGYTDGDGQARTVWLTTSDTLRQRLLLAEHYQLGGVAVAGLAASGVPAGLVNAVTQYKAAMDAAVTAHAELLWTVRNAGGIVALATAQPGQPYVYVAPGPGSYQFSAQLQPGEANDLGSVAVQIAAITSTPTPTSTPTATATQGGGSVQEPPATTAPGQATAAPTTPPDDGGGGVFVPPPPIGAGTFELGGQVPGVIGHPAQMQQAGMKWVKFQVRGGGADYIAAAHGAGFKVLLSVIGDKARVTDPAYMDEYAGWVAGLAAAGADAIEVWNEPNIEHEWPEGQINAATYTQLLAKAYNAIKAANGGTLVISGGPAPTGAEGAFPGKVVNDDRYLREMAAAGAANYMDCIGAHFNQGTTSPNDVTGANLNGYHYSYYFWPMVDTYWGAFGGTRPVCFTELGYLTSEGFGALPGGFAWGATTSLAEQAQWLAEAASLAGNSGQVRLMIVWNVDFTQYGVDPQAGYAIVRPDGSCPACASLGAVVH
ncbi:MAG: hypothetical protein IT317_13295 [Anaerolineales bacterium]|nr:hypothetical protein [Anaerolineales bacterium]